jgi:hypothetical protein
MQKDDCCDLIENIMMVNLKLSQQFLKDGKKWKRKATNISRIFLLKISSTKGGHTSLDVEVNPVNSYGSITRRREIVVIRRSGFESEELINLNLQKCPS